MRRFIILLLLWLFIPAMALAMTSANLQQIRSETASGYRIDYVNADGVLTMAWDKGYACMVRVEEQGKIVEEYYYDENFKPIAVSGYYGKQNKYEDGRLVRITYVDAEHHPTKNTSGYAIVKRVVDDAGHVILEQYFDEKEQPVPLTNGQYGISRTDFDEKDRVTRFVYLDRDGKPMVRKDGIAVGFRSYDENGNSYKTMYYDLQGKTAVLSHGHSGIRVIRSDETSKHIGTTYLDPEGKPMITTQGYATILYEYDEWNNICRYTYYDAEGQPIALSRGQYGQIIEYRKKQRLQSWYVDENGQKIFLLDDYLHQNAMLNLMIAAILVVLASILPKRYRLALLGTYLLFILYMTLLVRESGNQRSNLELFWSYRQIFTNREMRDEVLNNILLFVPFGALLYSLYPRKRVFLAVFALTVLIETVQFVSGLGLCELDDIFGNTLGGLIGCAAVSQIMKIKRNKNNDRLFC